MTESVVRLYCFILVTLVATAIAENSYSCKSRRRDPNAASGIYQVALSSGIWIEVYCEMGLNNGGYTFINPTDLARMTSADLQELYTEPNAVLLRTRGNDGNQLYAVLQQLEEHSTIPIKLALNDYTGYVRPYYLDYFGQPYLYVGFLPNKTAELKDVKRGFKINGIRNDYYGGNQELFNEITLFPNFDEKSFDTNIAGGGVCDNLYYKAKENPSGRIIPEEYFMFAEMRFGSGGCRDYVGRYKPFFLGFAIGFR